MTLKSFDQDGWLNDEILEIFESFEKIDSRYLTKAGDVVVRMSSPYTAITIDKEHEDILVPSLFVMIRLKNESLLPEYISVYLNSTQMEKIYLKESSGSTIKTIRTSAFKDFEIPVLELKYQQKAAELIGLMKKEKQLLQALIEKKDLFNNTIMTQILNGGFKNGRN